MCNKKCSIYHQNSDIQSSRYMRALHGGDWMKRKLTGICLVGSLLLVACGNTSDTSSEANEENSKPTTQSSETTEKKKVADFKSMIEDNLRDGDKINHFSNEDDILKVDITLAKDDLLEPYMLAETAYASISEHLLSVDGWNTLTINFENVGEISFNRDEAQKNDYGSYFKNEEIINRLSQN